jgi:hypothetical protein
MHFAMWLSGYLRIAQPQVIIIVCRLLVFGSRHAKGNEWRGNAAPLAHTFESKFICGTIGQ